MRMYDIIEKKKRGAELSEAEIRFFVRGAADGTIPEYQTTALLMAIYFKDMTDAETYILTREMTASGDTADLSALGDMTADKHSTGGVGDTATLIAVPIAAALGVKAAKLSGRGLGFTGGTIDKLESIPGFNTALTAAEFTAQVRRIGIAVSGQTGNIAPADKKLYALRDVTATVDSVPLIASSIMSKKLASGCKNIVLDVKYGSGAFMKTFDAAKALAEKMIAIGKSAGRNTAAVVSEMDTPLGDAVGNSLEVREAIRVFNGGGSRTLREMSVVTAALMYALAAGKDFEECRPLAEAALNDGRAFEKLREMIAAQSGDVSYIDRPEKFPTAKTVIEYKAEKSGYIFSTDCEKIGTAAMLLGAGRAAAGDKPDMSAGIVFNKKLGDTVEKGDVIARLYTGRNYDEALSMLDSAVKISGEKPNYKFSYVII
ncbi:MAG: thymidine phosphorylase [Firmicutes bacterium]|nr:thymidine phosphorylase [Bacillota bacterium]